MALVFRAHYVVGLLVAATSISWLQGRFNATVVIPSIVGGGVTTLAPSFLAHALIVGVMTWAMRDTDAMTLMRAVRPTGWIRPVTVVVVGGGAHAGYVMAGGEFISTYAATTALGLGIAATLFTWANRYVASGVATLALLLTTMIGPSVPLAGHVRVLDTASHQGGGWVVPASMFALGLVSTSLISWRMMLVEFAARRFTCGSQPSEARPTMHRGV